MRATRLRGARNENYYDHSGLFDDPRFEKIQSVSTNVRSNPGVWATLREGAIGFAEGKVGPDNHCTPGPASATK